MPASRYPALPSYAHTVPALSPAAANPPESGVVPAAAADARPQARRLEGEAALRTELIAAVDHDLRTSLTTVLGALQTMARPELAPADPDLAALLSSALAQAQKMRRLLDELLAASSPAGGRPLLPPELAYLLREVAGTGDGGAITVEVPTDLDPVCLSAPGLRRALAGILSRVPLRAGTRVAVSGEEGDCRITIAAEGQAPWRVPGLTARLVAAMGGRIEEAGTAESRALRLIFPGACRVPPG